jgi:hypothetical protein
MVDLVTTQTIIRVTYDTYFFRSWFSLEPKIIKLK